MVFYSTICVPLVACSLILVFFEENQNGFSCFQCSSALNIEKLSLLIREDRIRSMRGTTGERDRTLSACSIDSRNSCRRGRRSSLAFLMRHQILDDQDAHCAAWSPTVRSADVGLESSRIVWLQTTGPARLANYKKSPRIPFSPPQDLRRALSLTYSYFAAVQRRIDDDGNMNLRWVPESFDLVPEFFDHVHLPFAWVRQSFRLAYDYLV